MRLRQNYTILVMGIIWTTIQVGCVSSSAHPESEKPKPIAGTIDEQSISDNTNNQDRAVSQPLQESPPSGPQNLDTKVTSPVAPVCPFAPSSMRVHPLTRIIPNTEYPDHLQIDMRLELNDRFGDTTKGIGLLRIRLFPSLSSSQNGNPDIRIALWKPEFQDVNQNVLHFDRITRTYHFLLDVPEGVRVPANSTIVVTLTTSTGVLNARRDLQFLLKK